MNYFKKNKKIVTLCFLLGLIILMVGFSYAFFMFYKTGLYTHTITGGKMKVIYDEVTGNNIVIDNAYPRTDEEALTYGIEFEFTVTGYNESEKNVYYAIEMDHGDDVENKNRFLDSDMKLTLYENDEIIFENEIFNNLDNQDIHYNYFERGTSKENPTTNNYKLRIWINDYVFITNTPEAYNTEGLSVYSTSEFANSYANFKVNIKADLTYDGIGYLTYDANGGEYIPNKSSLTTGRVTMQKPVLENKAFLGWSTTSDGELEYQAGSVYTGEPRTLYAVYGNTKNVMGTWPTEILSIRDRIAEVHFINETRATIDERYNSSPIAVDLTYNNQGSVKGWVEEYYYDSENDIEYYSLYIGSEGTTYLTNCYGMFVDFISLVNIDFSNVDTSMVTDMSYMFSMSVAPDYVNPIPISLTQNTNKNNTLEYNNKEYDAENLSGCDATYIPYNCLTYLDLEAFNTSNVTDMSYMFYTIGGNNNECRDFARIYLEDINLINFDTSQVTDMSYMFSGSSLLEVLDLRNFNTSNVLNMSHMFYNCFNLLMINLESFDTSNVSNIDKIFGYCQNLYKLDLSSFNTEKITDMSSMFSYCYNLKALNVSSFNTEKITDMSSMFSYCYNLKALNVSSFNTQNVTDMSFMFSYCNNLQKIDVSTFDTGNVTTMENMFCSCQKLTTLNLKKFNTSKVKDMSSMFYGCSKLVTLDLSSFDTSKVTNMSWMFSNTGLTQIDLDNFDTSFVTNMSYMFSGCDNLSYLDIRHFDTSSVYEMNYLLNGTGNANSKFYISINTSNSYFSATYLMADVEASFASVSVNASCDFSFGGYFRESIIKQVNIEVSGEGVIKTDTMLYGTDVKKVNFKNYNNLEISFSNCFWGFVGETIDLSNFDTNGATNMSLMFYECANLKNLDLSNFDTSLVTDMSAMFYGCSSLTSLDLSNFDTSNVNTYYRYTGGNPPNQGIFGNCTSLMELDISSFDFETSNRTLHMFYNMPGNAKIYVKNETVQNLVLNPNSSYPNDRPAWTTDNVIIKNS